MMVHHVSSLTCGCPTNLSIVMKMVPICALRECPTILIAMHLPPTDRNKYSVTQQQF